MIKLNTIYNEHNSQTMQGMDAGIINLVMTSPPYAEARKRNYGGVHPDLYIEWFLPIAANIYRVLKQDGSFVLNIGDNTIDGETHLYTYNLPGVICRELGFKLIDAFIWHKKTTPPGKYHNRFKGAGEFCFHFAKQKNIKIFPQAVAVPTQEQSRERVHRHRDKHIKNSKTNSGFTQTCGGIINRKLSASGSGTENVNVWAESISRRLRKTGSNFGTNDQKLLGYDVSLPSNVLHLAPESTNKGHSAVFPEALPEFFIKAFTDEGDIVYDPFSGSGTTCAVAKRLNRNYIGSEIVRQQFLHSLKRVNP